MEVDAEVIENWITLRAEPVKTTFIYTVKRDTAIIFEGQLGQNDTLLHDENLQPATTYTYTAFAQKGKEKSKTVTAMATTMDTTSHEFTWQTFEWSGRGSSILFDVAIISPDDIWAVGEIHTQDTDKWNEDSTEWIQGFNAVHWDGNEWELKRIKTRGCGGVIYPPMETLYAFESNDIIFAHVDGSITKFNGEKFVNNCDLIYTLNGSTTKIWGITNTDYYVTSGNGFIAHYDGQSWTKIESGTDIDIRDIYGAQNPETGEYEILGVASNVNKDTQIKFFQVKNNKVIDLPLDGLTHFFDGIWFKSNSKYYIVGTGIFENNRFFKTQFWNTYAPGAVTSYHTRAIAANDINDIIAVGAYNEVVHFNGKTWKNYNNNIFAAYYEVDINNNLVIAVGFNGRNAQLLIGRR